MRNILITSFDKKTKFSQHPRILSIEKNDILYMPFDDGKVYYSNAYISDENYLELSKPIDIYYSLPENKELTEEEYQTMMFRYNFFKYKFQGQERFIGDPEREEFENIVKKYGITVKTIKDFSYKRTESGKIELHYKNKSLGIGTFAYFRTYGVFV